MSDPSLFASPLARQAARNLHRLELLAENPAWTDWVCRWNFWRTRRMMAMTPDEAAAWLPAVAFAVSCEKDADILAQFARWPLPEPLPPEALPWRDRLIRSWEQYRPAIAWEKTIRLSALVRLDRRVERLPEWLKEARRALDLTPENRYPRLAALAGWRPRPGDGPPHGDKAEAARAWVRFWEESYKSPDMDGLIAAAALLHLAESGWLPGGLSPERLREELRQRVQQLEKTWYHRLLPGIVLASVPAGSPSPEQQDITGWLELTRKDIYWEERAAVWGMLVSWQREGILERCGISLVPDLARTLEWERSDYVLLAVAGYVPEAAEVSAHPEAARAVVARWEALSRSGNQRIRQTAWVARWNLRRAEVLTAEEQGRFDADYVEAIGSENDRDVLLALAQITPPGTFPLATWAGRLSDQNRQCRLAAYLAIHITRHSPLAITRRQMRQVLRRAGQDIGDGTVAPFVNLPSEVLPDFRRLHEIETALAAGQMPPPPNAGMENQLAPRTVPARLPETQPRMDPTSHTSRAGAAKSTPRHPSPEKVRHE